MIGDMAYTAGLERTSVSVDGKPRTYTLRATQVYRREEGQWKVVHVAPALLIEARSFEELGVPGGARPDFVRPDPSRRDLPMSQSRAAAHVVSV